MLNTAKIKRFLRPFVDQRNKLSLQRFEMATSTSQQASIGTKARYSFLIKTVGKPHIKRRPTSRSHESTLLADRGHIARAVIAEGSKSGSEDLMRKIKKAGAAKLALIDGPTLTLEPS